MFLSDFFVTGFWLNFVPFFSGVYHEIMFNCVTQQGLPLHLPFYIYSFSFHETEKYFKTELQSFMGCINVCNFLNSFYVW
jgi:hypothetical protein